MKNGIMLQIPAKGEVFTYDDGEGNIVTFAVFLMQKFIEKTSPKDRALLRFAKFQIDPAHIEKIKKDMGIEQDRLDRLKAPYVYKRCIAILDDKGKQFNIIDGNHRLVKLHSLGEKYYNVAIFAPPLWRQFIWDVPLAENWREARSGIIENFG